MLDLIYKPLKWLTFLALSITSQAATAGFVTINETGVDAIFSQSSFTSAIDIRFLTATEYVASDLLIVDSEADFTSLSNYTTSTFASNQNVLPMFFLDSISYCGSSGSNIVGCASTPYNSANGKSVFGSFSIFNSSTASMNSGMYNDELLAHELAHNLGLFAHIDGSSTNLMNPVLFDYGVGVAPLTTDQVSSIFNLGSFFIQQDDNGYFIEIAPIAIVSSLTTAVPEPETYLMFGIGLMAIISRKKYLKSLS